MVESRHVLRVPATLTGLHDATGSLLDLLEAQHLPDAARYNVELAFEEIVANIVRHGRPTADIDVTILFGDADTILTFEDDGIPFNPCEQTVPPPPASLDEAKVGGLGIPLIKAISTRMEYERTPENRNRLLVAIPAS